MTAQEVIRLQVSEVVLVRVKLWVVGEHRRGAGRVRSGAQRGTLHQGLPCGGRRAPGSLPSCRLDGGVRHVIKLGRHQLL